MVVRYEEDNLENGVYTWRYIITNEHLHFKLTKGLDP